MKLATIVHQGRPTVAVVDPDRGLLWPLADVVPGLPPLLAGDMVATIGHLSHLRALPTLGSAGLPLDEATLLAPIPSPPHNVMCVGKNYHAHAHEFARSGFDAGARPDDAIPEFPIIFTKPSGALAGPYDDIPLWPGLDQAVDYEAELAVVIGRAGRFIARDDAMSHVFGYTILNDVTARDLQRRHKQWFLGKGIDGFGPMGPWITTADEVDGANLRVTCQVNGELRQDCSTADLIFDIPALIETISCSVTLSPGDVIATGTPVGVGIGFDPPRFLRDGDVVEVAIEGLGHIRNTVRRMDVARHLRAGARGSLVAMTDLFVEEFGGKGDVLVMVHGLGGSTNTWFPQSQVLTRDLRLVAYDLAGSGRSPVRDAISIESHVGDLLEVIRQAGGRAHLAGHSLGTIVCQHFAVAHPDRVASLALLGPFPQPPEPARTGLRDRAGEGTCRGHARHRRRGGGRWNRRRYQSEPAGGDRLRPRKRHGAAAGGLRPQLRGAVRGAIRRPGPDRLPDAAADRRPGPHRAARRRPCDGQRHPGGRSTRC